MKNMIKKLAIIHCSPSPFLFTFLLALAFVVPAVADTTVPQHGQHDVLIWTPGYDYDDVDWMYEFVERLYDIKENPSIYPEVADITIQDNWTEDALPEDISEYEMICIFAPGRDFTETEKSRLGAHLASGGRLMMLGENAYDYDPHNQRLRGLAALYGATFNVTTEDSGVRVSEFNENSQLLTPPLSKYPYGAYVAKITYWGRCEWIAKVVDGGNDYVWMVDEAAGPAGQMFGRVTMVSDLNWIDDQDWHLKPETPNSVYSLPLIVRLLTDAANGRQMVAEGGDPNEDMDDMSDTQYAVMFKTLGHGGHVDTQWFAMDGTGVVTKPTDPVASGYVFGGWYTSPSCCDGEEYDFSRNVISTIKLYAKWTTSGAVLPPAPKALDGYDLTSTGFSALWKVTSRAASYEVEVHRLPDCSDESVVTVEVTDVNSTFANVGKSLETFYYRVRAVDENKAKSEWSNVVSVTLPHRHCVCGTGSCNVYGHAHEDQTWMVWTDTGSLPDTPGCWCLVNDVTLTASYEPPSGVSLCLNGRTVTAADGSRLVNIASGSSLVVTDCGSCGCLVGSTLASGDGAGVVNAGQFELYAGALSNCTATAGNGGAVRNDGFFAIYGGSISGNVAGLSGGAIFNAGVMTMYGGTIADNRANDAASGGGAVYTATGGALNIFGGSILNNSAGSGGALYACMHNTTVYGGYFKGNAAAVAGQLFMGMSSAKNGSLYGGVFADGDPTSVAQSGECFKLMDEATVETVGANMVVGKLPVAVSGKLDGGVYTFCPTNAEYVAGGLQLCDGKSPAVISGAITRWLVAVPHVHCLCGDGLCTAEGHVCDPTVEWLPWSATDSLPTEYGNYYLMNDVVLTSHYEVPIGNVRICLNGMVITQTSADESIAWVENGTLTVTDCDTTTKRHFIDGDGDGCYETCSATPSEGSIEVTGGVVTGVKASTFWKAAFYIENTFNLYRGTVIGNLGDGSACAAAVYSWHGIFNLLGGRIVGNASGKYGALYSDYGLVNIAAGVIERNRGCYSGALFSDERVDMSGGAVRNNVATDAGGVGGIHTWYYGSYCPGNLYLTGGEITGNVGGYAGGVCGIFDVFEVGGAVRISGNTLSDGVTPSNVRLDDGYVMAVSETEPFADGAQIGVTTENAPTEGAMVPVTGVNASDCAQYFASDKAFTVTNDANVVKLAMNNDFMIVFKVTADDVTCGGQPFTSSNVTYTIGGSVAQTPVLERPQLTVVGWATSASAVEPEYTTAQLSTITTERGAIIVLYPVWLATVRIPVFVALDGLGVVPQDGRTYEVSITNGSYTTPLQPCCTNLILACPIGTGDVYRVGFATNDVTNPWTLTLGEGTYIYDIRQKTVARPGEQLAEGTWRTCVKVNLTEKPYVTLTDNEYLDAIDDLSEGAFKAFVKSGQASFSVKERYIILGSDTQKAGDSGEFNRALVKSKFAFDFSRSFRVDGTMQVGNAADGTAIGFVPNGQDLVIKSDFNDGGSALGCYLCSKNGNGLFLEFDTLGDGSGWGGQTDYIGNTAHFVLTTTDADGKPSNVKGQNVVFGNNYALPSEVMNYSIDYDSFSKEMLFTIKTTTKTWKLAYTNPPAVFGSMKAYMTLSGAMRYSPANSFGVGSWGSPAPKTKITIATFNYVNDSMTGAVENTFRNRQEALVTYNAWGGEIVPGEETTQAFANAARYACPVDPERKGYTFLGWYESWTNSAANIVHGEKMNPIVDRTVYAKWLSPSTPQDKGEKTYDFESVGDGALLKGATNKLEKTDLAIPEFTSNGANGIPYVIIKQGAFTRENYDKQRELDLRAAGVPRIKQTTNDLTSVTISTYVTNIQMGAFQDCQQLTNVVFSKTRDYLTGEPTKLVVNDWAFRNTAIRSVVFPAGSTVVLDYGSFADAQYLEEIYLRGDVELTDLYPFAGAGVRYVKQDPDNNRVKVHLSAKLAADSAFVAALTNGMAAARVVLDQKIEGKVSLANFTIGTSEVSVTFKVDDDSPWTKVTSDTVYLFYSTTLKSETFIGNDPKRPTSLTKNDDGSWTAVFEKPATAGSTAVYYQLCIGE